MSFENLSVGARETMLMQQPNLSDSNSQLRLALEQRESTLQNPLRLDAGPACGAPLRSRLRGAFAPILILTLLAIAPISNAFSQTPYLGGKGDGYASRFTQISAVQQAIAPAWMIVYPSPVRSGAELEVTVFDVKAEVAAELFDVLGKRLYTLGQPLANGEVHLRLPTTGLASGIYLLRVSRDADAFTQKVIVWEE
jgi:Secretion system C-terminal sorting domain